ncbi:hypothetical protein BDV59DRAFT_205541 [Aspergillus ambiguus]|uniref:uncharacterized protein n=1 Tax=Aspergillus ambiguus TaxID=176160 RepID=UPI003CCCF5E7
MVGNPMEDGLRPYHQKRPSGTTSPSGLPTSSFADRPADTSSDTTGNASGSGTETPTISTHGPTILPQSSPGKDNIKEGLASLNRWSQSTTSSAPASPRTGLSPARTGARTAELPQRDDDDLPKLHLPEIGALPSLSSGIIGTAPWQNEAPPESENMFQDPWLKPTQHTKGSSSDSIGIPGQTFHRNGDSVDAGLPFRNNQSHDRRKKSHSQKAMLSKALQKANTAVLLDNAANFEGAMEAYNDACQLLQLVMLRSSGGEDEKLKLQEIRDTYMIRVTELERMDFSLRGSDSKALPERPLSQESYGEMFQPIESNQDSVFADGDLDSQNLPTNHSRGDSKVLSPDQIPVRRQSLLPSAMDDDIRFTGSSAFASQKTDSSAIDVTWRESGNEKFTALDNSQALDSSHMDDQQSSRDRYSELSLLSTHTREIYESTSWLDTIDESGASSPASLRSKASSIYLRQRRSRRLSRGTEAEFDAALDAAVEAAYDEGLEPVEEHEKYDEDDDIVANARRNVELAKQKVREAEKEAEFAMNRGRELRRLQEQAAFDTSNGPTSDYLDEEAEEEERILEEMTRGYIMDDFEFDIQSKSALPRQSDSSSFSGRTWESSAASNTTNAAATAAALSPLAEDSVLPIEDMRAEPKGSSLSKNLPTLPAVPDEVSTEATASPGVRARRMSGRTSAELRIETNAFATKPKSDVSSQDEPSEPFPPPPLPKDEPSHGNGVFGRIDEESANVSKMPSPVRPIGKVPSAPDNLSKINPGLKPFRARNVSVPIPETSAHSPETPSSSAFPAIDLQKTAATATVPILPTPTGANFAPNGLPSDGLYLFDSHIHSPTSLGSPNLMAANAPQPLEPCPESFLLRPFWLMRCIYQTVAHPRGGYLTTKLFIPRDIWRVKNVKLKAVEEKVSNCDLLTAALLKLAKVDTYDADAVLEEMQSFETVLDQVQASLTKKIGSEVGVQGAMPLFRSAQPSDDPTTVETPPAKTSSGQSKSYLSSWRKLRSKNSGVGGTPTPSTSREPSKDNLTITSLPMTPIPSSQPRRNTTQLQFSGPNSNYMGALARLCDAVQVLDQIAQQVEDPGLKHSSPTLVGLELSTRHAAEFFGFYVCRFVLNDIGMMLDKFIKRGSEWVLI